MTGHQYVLTDEHPCCIPCYEQNFTHVCRVCERRIGLDSKDMSYKDLHWHEDCFKCRKCKLSLVDKPFAARNALIFCAGCYDAEFAARCDACGDTFRPGKTGNDHPGPRGHVLDLDHVIGTKKMEYKTRKWHDKCFQCVVCKTQVGSKPFIIPNETDVYCVGCFEEKFATKCTKCKKIMTTGGVTFKNEVNPVPLFFQRSGMISRLFFRLGIGNVLSVRIATRCWRDKSSPRDRTSPIARTASASSSPRGARPARSPSRGRGAPGSSRSRVATGTQAASSAPSARSRWPARASSRTARTSSAPTAPRTSSWPPRPRHLRRPQRRPRRPREPRAVEPRPVK